MRKEHDKYYTPLKVIKYINKKLTKYIDFDKVDCFLDPCCGDDRWLKQLRKLYPNKKFKSYDKYPDEGISYGDFLNSHTLTYKERRMIITNPPYGLRNTLTFPFISKALKVAGYVCMLVPYNTKYSTKVPKPDYCIVLKDAFKEDVRAVKTAMLIYLPSNVRERQKGSNWNSKDSIRYSIFGNSKEALNKVWNKHVFAFCAWGKGSMFNLVKPCTHIYSKTMVMYFDNLKEKKRFKKYIKQNLFKLREFYVDKFGESTCISYPYLRKLVNIVLGKC